MIPTGRGKWKNVKTKANQAIQDTEQAKLKKSIFKALNPNNVTWDVSKQEKPIVIEEHRNAANQVLHFSAVLSSSPVKSFYNECTDLQLRQVPTRFTL